MGESATLDVVGPGALVGEQALIPPPARRAATAVALETTETQVLTADEFSHLRAQHPAVDAALLAVLVRRNRAATARLVEALDVRADVRGLRRLLDLADVYGGGDGRVVPLTQEDLAGLAGTTRETVNRVLRKEAELGAVALSRGKVTVLDTAAIAGRAR